MRVCGAAIALISLLFVYVCGDGGSFCGDNAKSGMVHGRAEKRKHQFENLVLAKTQGYLGRSSSRALLDKTATESCNCDGGANEVSFNARVSNIVDAFGLTIAMLQNDCCSSCTSTTVACGWW